MKIYKNIYGYNNLTPEAVRLARVKNAVKRESDESIMLQEVLRKLNKIETKKESAETTATISNY